MATQLNYNAQTKEYEEIEVEDIVIVKTAEEIKQEYENTIVNEIRKKYSLNEELAILRQRDTKVEEFEVYSAYVEKCKQKAKN